MGEGGNRDWDEGHVFVVEFTNDFVAMDHDQVGWWQLLVC